MLPQVGQGALAVECRADDTEMLELLSAADDSLAHRQVDAERSWLSAIGGGCNAPVAAFAQPVRGEPGMISLEAMIATYDGRIVLRRSARGSDPEELGRRLAGELLGEGGGSSLDEWTDRESQPETDSESQPGTDRGADAARDG
jgi:hydroxymethylbilane synthase